MYSQTTNKMNMELTTKEKREIVNRLINNREVAIDCLLDGRTLIHSNSEDLADYQLNSIEKRNLTAKEWKIFLAMPVRILQWVVEGFTSTINKKYCQTTTEQDTLDEMWRILKNENKISVLMFIFGFNEDELKEYFAGQISMTFKKYSL